MKDLGINYKSHSLFYFYIKAKLTLRVDLKIDSKTGLTTS